MGSTKGRWRRAEELAEIEVLGEAPVDHGHRAADVEAAAGVEHHPQVLDVEHEVEGAAEAERHRVGRGGEVGQRPDLFLGAGGEGGLGAELHRAGERPERRVAEGGGGVVPFGQGMMLALGGYAAALSFNHLGITDILLLTVGGGAVGGGAVGCDVGAAVGGGGSALFLVVISDGRTAR